MDKLVEIVNDRNAIVDGLDEDRLRWGAQMNQAGVQPPSSRLISTAMEGSVVLPRQRNAMSGFS